MNLTRRCSQPTLIITVELFTIRKPTSTNLALKFTSAHTSACIRGHVVPFCQEIRAPNPMGSIHIHPNMTIYPQPGMSCVLIPAMSKLQRLNDLVSWNGIEYDSWGELQVKHLLGFVNLTHPGKVWHSKLSMATSSNYSTLGLNIKGIQGHCVFTFLVLCFKGPL